MLLKSWSDLLTAVFQVSSLKKKVKMQDRYNLTPRDKEVNKKTDGAETEVVVSLEKASGSKPNKPYSSAN